jgi:hypothetical protein
MRHIDAAGKFIVIIEMIADKIAISMSPILAPNAERCQQAVSLDQSIVTERRMKMQSRAAIA